ncbi:MAG: capsid protein, partial [Lachnospiraceae bacterium]|nr:capsid protein [Lachnospiraceae bacterium]
STLGIDTKKLDNAEAQREKEKTTLYTRNAIIEALQETIPELVAASVNAYRVLAKKQTEEVKVEVTFGEYANPSFESQIETMAKARPSSPIMSVEAQVDELYRDNKEQTWKDEEVARIKAEMGIQTLEEPSISLSAGGFHANTEEQDESKSRKENLPDVEEGVPGAS